MHKVSLMTNPLLQLKHLASVHTDLEWWTRQLKDLSLHDNIWFNAMRVLVSQESRKEASIADHMLDHLIRIGLIDRDEAEVSKPMQQWLRYLAILADRLANSQGVVAKEVKICFIKSIRTFINNFYSCPPSRVIVRRRWPLVLNT